jgi:hypothetical protein
VPLYHVVSGTARLGASLCAVRTRGVLTFGGWDVFPCDYKCTIPCPRCPH